MIEKDVCIAGGGPAGMLLGLLLARAGVKVLVLEQHKDFSREYRGEVLMPRFTHLFQRLGLFHLIEKNAHLKLEAAELFYKENKIGEISFSKVVPEIPFALWMPQPVLLQALYDEARQYRSFEMWFDTSARSLIREGSKAAGLYVKRGKDEDEIRAKVTVGTDGRFSTLRRAGRFKTTYREHQFDVVWFTIPKPKGYENRFRVFLSKKHNLLILPKYPNSIQCGLIIAPGDFLNYRKAGIDSIRKVLMDSHSLVHEFARNLKDFNEFNVLQAELELIEHWAQDGLLLAGDSAHTMSPVGAVGVSIAVETAAVAAGIVIRALEKNNISAEVLNEVQKVREPEIRAIHKIQHAFSGTLLTRYPVGRFLLPLFLPFILKIPFARKFQRYLAFLQEPMLLDPSVTV